MFEPGTHNVIHNQSRAYAREACEGALKRLDTDTIDLFTLRGPVQVGFGAD
jgi:aryl-alcohol dehydrogenase-like predicted oxidoreductase